MAKCKILKSGETDIESTDIWRFAIHSDYISQKIALVGSKTLVLPAYSLGTDGDSVSGTIAHNLGYTPLFFAFVQYNGKGYEATGNANPQIPLQTARFFAVSTSLDYLNTYGSEISGSSSAIASNLQIGDEVRVKAGPTNGGVLPAPLQPNTSYYVVTLVDTTKFEISASPGGGKIDIVDSGGTDRDFYENVTSPVFGSSGAGFDISADNTNLNITLFATGLEKTAKDETFTIQAFFIQEEII